MRSARCRLRGRSAPPASTNFWVSGDYALSLFKGGNLPTLVTTSPAGTARTSAGVLGAPGTSTLFGGGTVDDDVRSGFRLGSGFWFNAEHSFGIEAGFFMTGSHSADFSDSSNSSTIIARPYYDAVTGLPQAVLVAFPGSTAGSIDISARSGNYYDGNIDLVGRTYDAGWYRLDSMFGYRYYYYAENLAIQQSITPTNANFVPGTQIVSNDNFRTRNVFNGFDMGFRSEFFWNSMSLELLTKIAVGDVYSLVNINGNQTITVPGTAPVFTSGGVLALPSNIGAYSYTHLTTLPEFGATFKWQATSNLQFRVGYSFLFLDGIMRAGNQVENRHQHRQLLAVYRREFAEPARFQRKSIGHVDSNRQLWIDVLVLRSRGAWSEGALRSTPQAFSRFSSVLHFRLGQSLAVFLEVANLDQGRP